MVRRREMLMEAECQGITIFRGRLKPDAADNRRQSAIVGPHNLDDPGLYSRMPNVPQQQAVPDNRHHVGDAEQFLSGLGELVERRGGHATIF